jgi:epoxyqueuosine reductase
MTQEAFIHWAKEKGYRISFADIGLLDLVKEKLERRKADGEFPPGFYEDNLGIFKCPGKGALRRFESILIVAVPAPAHILKFEREGGEVATILPPTYLRYRPLFEQVREEIQGEVLGGKPGIEILQAPLKSLAVVSGLAVYGRNNLTYIPGLGSFYQLAGYLFDGIAESANPPDRLDRSLGLCGTCRACIKACTMGAICEDRFLIHAERCYTLLSESSRPIPDNIHPPSPECLIGCLRCQEVCPANKGMLKRVQAPVSFTAAETEALLNEGEIRDRRLNTVIEAKFKTLGVSEGVPIFRRNLRRLVKLRTGSPAAF